MIHGQLLKIERQDGAWCIKQPGSTHTASIKVDSAVVNATKVGNSFVEGYIVAVHGLDQDIAEHLDPLQLKALGVGAQYRARPAGQRGTRRVSLLVDGTIQGGIR